MCFVPEFVAAVHADCQQLQNQVAATADLMLQQAAHDSGRVVVPMGLKERTKVTYWTEWRLYISFSLKFCDSKELPGRDVPWNAILLWRYLLMRSETCKPSSISSCLSALSACSLRYNHLLPTQKSDGDSLLRRQLVNMKREIAIRYNEGKGKNVEVKKSTPLAKQDVELMLSSLQVWDEARFNKLSRRDRHEVNACTMQHGCAMRFGHFLYRAYTVDMLLFGADGAVRLVTDWHRYSGMRRYCLQFVRVPRWSCLSYDVRDVAGVRRTTLTAGTILRWHVARLRRDGESVLYRPFAHKTATRKSRRDWLRQLLWQALPADEVAARRAVAHVTPHAFRAGLGGDMHRAGVAWDTIAVWCRWLSYRAMRMYASRPSLSTLRTSTTFRVPSRNLV